MTIDLHHARERLERATSARAEGRRLVSRRAALEPDLVAARSEAQRLRQELAGHQQDVDKLSGPSVSRVLASLGGGLTEKLSERQAQAERVRYELDVAESRLARFTREADQLEGDLALLGHTEISYEEALSDLVLAARASGQGMADEVTQDAGRRLEQLQRRREVQEALQAGEVALRHLQAARKRFSDASDWSAFDLFAGGGMLAGMMKHDRIDKATGELRSAAAAVERFSHELGDVHLPGVTAPVIDEFERGIDVWFDNIFTDLRVNSRITEARDQLEEAIRAVEASMARLRSLRAELADA